METQKITSAIQTPPLRLFQYLEEQKAQFRRLERFFPTLAKRRQIEKDVEEVGGDGWTDPVGYLPYDMRALMTHAGDGGGYDHPLSQRIKDLQEYARLKLPSDAIRQARERLVNLPTDRDEYRRFFEYYYAFIKEYPDLLRELHTQADPDESELNKQASEAFQTYRTALDATYRYVTLYLKFAVRMQAESVRQQMREDAYFNGKSERKQRPPAREVEVLFHASVSVPVILREGFKTRDELGGGTAGLGGGPSDVVSFTADLDIAKGIVDALRVIVQIAHGEVTLEQVVGMVDAEGLERADYQLDRLRMDYGAGKSPQELVFEAYKKYLWMSPTKYNPVFFGSRIEFFEKMKLPDIGIIAARIDMSQVSEYLMGEEEFRVPASAILSAKRVLY